MDPSQPGKSAGRMTAPSSDDSQEDVARLLASSRSFRPQNGVPLFGDRFHSISFGRDIPKLQPGLSPTDLASIVPVENMTSDFMRRPGLSPFPELEGKHAVVLGGAGFLGSHICTWLTYSGATVTCIDNMITGNPSNVGHLFGHSGFKLLDYDVTDFLHVSGPVHYVLNFASPASPVDYLRWPIHTLKVGALGTHKGLGLALAKGAVFFLASTSEVYGDPLVNPQPETYWGNVNPVGPRGVYDEAKRFAEALTLAYHRQHGLPVRIVRIFNTFGPRMRGHDGRAIPAFFTAALQNLPLPVHGDGSQTRSLCYVDDLVDGILRLLLADYSEPVNLGNPEEVTMLQLAELVQDVVGNHPGVEFLPRPIDDPTVRRPDTSRAAEILDWKPQIPLREGLEKTLPWFRKAVVTR